MANVRHHVKFLLFSQ